MEDAQLDVLVSRVYGLMEPDRRALLGITGAPGAGKSTVARAIVDELRADGIGVAVVPMDGFHLPQADLVERGLRDVMGRIDTFDADGYHDLLRRLRDEPDGSITAPDFDRAVEEPIPDAIVIGPDVRLVVTEGNYLLDADEPWPAIRTTLDEVWFVETDDATRVERLLARHVEFGKTRDDARRWMARVDDPNALRIQATREGADLAVDLVSGG